MFGAITADNPDISEVGGGEGEGGCFSPGFSLSRACARIQQRRCFADKYHSPIEYVRVFFFLFQLSTLSLSLCYFNARLTAIILQRRVDGYADSLCRFAVDSRFYLFFVFFFSARFDILTRRARKEGQRFSRLDDVFMASSSSSRVARPRDRPTSRST